MTSPLRTNAEITWCPGCGNFGILGSLEKAVRKLEELGVPRSRLFMTAGIGCHGKIFDYITMSGINSLHGRAVACGQGVKLANPDLKVLVFEGDGSGYGEGIEHLIFAAKRNADITVIVHDNGTYALTTGQSSPTSGRGHHGPSTPGGSVEDPLNPLALLLEAGATFVARGYSAKPDHLAELLVQGVMHEGFSLIDVIQPSVVFTNTYKEYNALVQPLEKPADTLEEAVRLAKLTDRMPIGVFYRIEKPSHHKALMGDLNPATQSLPRDERLRLIAEWLTSSMP